MLSHQTQKPVKVGNLGYKQIFDRDFVCVCLCLCASTCVPK